MPNAYDRQKCVTELRLRADVVHRVKNGRMPACDFEPPFTHPHKTDVVKSDAEETDNSSLGSSDTEDEGKVEQNTLQLDDTDNKVTGYCESV